MKKLLLSNLLVLIAFASFSQATKTSLGLGFPDDGWYSDNPPAAVTLTVGGGKFVFVADSLNQYAPINYRLNNGIGDKDSVTFAATNKAYAAVWASATDPLALRIDFLNSSNPGCKCPQDRAANKAAQKTSPIGTTIKSYLQAAVSVWEEDYSSDPAQNGPVDNSNITHINIYAVPLTAGQVNYSGTVTIDSIFISDSPIIFAGLNKVSFVSNSTNLFPNPVADIAKLDYTLIKPANIKLALYDLTGRQIAVISDSYNNAGKNHVAFDVKNYPQGIYTVAFTANGVTVQNEKLIIIK
jgi:hypothetical protein